MIPRELLKKVRGIQIRTSRMVNDLLAGQYHSTFKGRGIEFDEVREYQPGDEIRTIDWNVTARMGRPFIKKFVEERELTVMLLVDLSASERFGSVRTKKEVAAELCAVLAFSAIKNNDKVGLILFSDRIERFVPPKKGKRHVLRVIREALFFDAKGRGTDIAGALEFLNSVSARRSVVFLVSDFLAEGHERLMEVSNRRHDLIPVVIEDPREAEWCGVGLVELEDAETGSTHLVDTSDPNVRKAFSGRAQKARLAREKSFGRSDMDFIRIGTGDSIAEPLVKFFRKRGRKRSRV